MKKNKRSDIPLHSKELSEESGIPCREFSHYFPAFSPDGLTQTGTPGDALQQWIGRFDGRADNTYFPAGGVKLVARLRQELKRAGIPGRQINAQAFWR